MVPISISLGQRTYTSLAYTALHAAVLPTDHELRRTIRLHVCFLPEHPLTHNG